MADLLRHGRREEHRLSFLRQHRGDLPDRIDEAHVKHAVGFVEHEEVDLRKRHQLLLQQVDEAARRRHEDVEPLLDGAHLRTLTDATEDDRKAERRVPTVAREALGDLRREFARRRKHKRLRLAAERWTRVARQAFDQVVQDRQRECRGLPCTRLRDAEDVSALDGRRDRLGLDGRWIGVAIGRDRVEQWLCELERTERNGRGVLHGWSGGRVGRHEHLSPAGAASGHALVGMGRNRVRTAGPADGIKPVGARRAEEPRVPQAFFACCRLSPSLAVGREVQPEPPAENRTV